MIHAHGLAEVLRRLEPHAAGKLPVVRIFPDDPFVWESLRCCASCNLPGIDVGQSSDHRFSTDGPEGLHAQVFPGGYVDFHLDGADACRDLVAHAIRDTKMIEGAGLGLLAGAALCALTGGSALGTWLIVGGSGGGLAGANVPARGRWTVGLRDLLLRARPQPAF